MGALDGFIEGLPKAELRLHIEGTLEPELMFALAMRNGVALPYASIEALRAAYSFDALQEFLDRYYQGMAVLVTEQDFYDLTRAYLETARAEAVRHTEIFFDPQAHTARGVDFAAVIGGITRALDDAALVQRLAEARVPLTVCPLSNLRLAVIDDIAEHPLRRMIEKGLLVTVNSDDPAYFGGYINANYRAVTAALGLSRGDLVDLAHNSFAASFLDDDAKAARHAEVDAYAATA